MSPRTRFGTLALLGALAACSGGHSAFTPAQLPGSEGSAASSRAAARLAVSVTLPARSRVQSMTLAIAAGSGIVVKRAVLDVGAGKRGCAVQGAQVACSAAVALAGGAYVVAVATYAGGAGSGKVLSQGQAAQVSVNAGSTQPLKLTLEGVPTSYRAFSLSAVAWYKGGAFNIGPAVLWRGPAPFALDAFDGNSALIVGPNGPAYSIASSTSGFSIVQPNPATSNTFGVTPPKPLADASTLLTATARFANPSACTQPHAVCTAKIPIVFAPFALDDWTTFAHDQQRTGWQQQDTGISAASLKRLALRWKVNAGASFAGNPIVYGGNVFVVTTTGVAIDYLAASGKMLWQRTLNDKYVRSGKGRVLTTATLDAGDGVVFFGSRDFPPNSTAPLGQTIGPSQFWALRLSDGAVMWQRTLPMISRGSPVYANGVVYQGLGGGDAPWCENGGVVALNAKTGQTQWTWYLNALTNPGGGGGVWSPIAYDGQHLVFGTGNTCTNDAGLMQGAAALNTDGSMAWSFTAEDVLGYDDDTGGAVTLYGGNATFINKDGAAYQLDATTGARHWSTPLGAAQGLGGFASPGTNGAITVVSAGLISQSQGRSLTVADMCKLVAVDPIRARRAHTGYASTLKGIDSAGRVLWSYAMPAPLYAYVAVNDGIVYADNNTAIDALDIRSGKLLWSFNGGAYIYAGPVIVPSGIYMADSAGNVFALSLQ